MSSTGARNTSISGEPKASITVEDNQYSALEEKDSAPSNDPLKTSGVSSLLEYQKGETLALPTPEEAKDVTSGDADILYSIANDDHKTSIFVLVSEKHTKVQSAYFCLLGNKLRT